jgi:radical SAM superfamily enzyme with C-terminal helix-hairpin-helix motif
MRIVHFLSDQSSFRIAFTDVAIKEAEIQSVRSIPNDNAGTWKTKDQRNLNKVRVVDYETARDILEDLAWKDAKQEAEKLSRDYRVSKKASKIVLRSEYQVALRLFKLRKRWK